MLTVTIEGIDGAEKFLASLAKGLDQVPANFSKREDVKQSLRTIAQQSFDTVGIGNKTGASREAIRAESVENGIVVYEEVNADTEPKWAHGEITDAYVLFFLKEYARYSFSHEGLSKRTPRDFLRGWPELMKPTVERAFEQEVQKELAK